MKSSPVMVALLLWACSETDPDTGAPVDACPVDVQRVSCTDTMRNGASLQAHKAPSGKTAVSFSVAGDQQMHDGIPFDGSATSLVDGWAITFTSVLITLDHLQLTDPDADDPSKAVAEARGPFAVDLLNSGKGLSVALTGLNTENLVCNTPELSAKRYGFNYDVVPASGCARNVNLGAQALTDYQDMRDRGYTVMFSGRAEFQGVGCSEDFDHSLWPTRINFRIGTKRSLQNSQCAGGVTLGGSNAKAEVTVRSHLLFADALAEQGTSFYFDQIAARFADGVRTSALAYTEDFSSSPFNPFVQLSGDPLTYRSCSGGGGGDQMSFNPKGAAVSTYAEYLGQALVKQLRFNGNGLCSVQPPSPESTLNADDTQSAQQ